MLRLWFTFKNKLVNGLLVLCSSAFFEYESYSVKFFFIFKKGNKASKDVNRCFEYFTSEIYFVEKKCKETKNSSANYQTKEIICSTDYKSFQRIFTVYFASKKC